LEAAQVAAETPSSLLFGPCSGTFVELNYLEKKSIGEHTKSAVKRYNQ
jgi:hypothetical protein